MERTTTRYGHHRHTMRVRDHTPSSHLRVRLALVFVVAVYVVLAVAFSQWTPVGEANDELDHVQYIEYIVSTGSFPHISLVNGHESHQPPLYYLLGAGWQELLGAHAFHLVLPLASPAPYGVLPLHELGHTYTPSQRQDAVIVHELRYLSILLGLGTVLLTFKAAVIATGRRSIGLASASFVALVPKEIVVSSAVTNDVLVIFLGSLSLVLLLLWIRQDSSTMRQRLLALSLGLTLGAAVLTKFNALPLVAVYLGVMLVVILTKVRSLQTPLLLDPLLAALGFLSVTGWWLIRNQHLYGQALAQRASNAYLKKWLPPLIHPVSWFDNQRFLHFVPSSLLASGWYDGDWNQLQLPKALNQALWAAAILSIALFVFSCLRKNTMPVKSHLMAWIFLGSMLAGLAALLIIAQDTMQAEGRVTYVSLSAFAIVLVVGSSVFLRSARWKRVALLAWPLVLFGVDIYVLATFVYPGRGL